MKIVRRLRKGNLKVYKLWRHFKAFLAVAFCTICGIFLTIFMFFEIKSVECIGEMPYHEDEIITAASANLGKNVLLADISSATTTIEENFPYLENVEVARKIPDKIVISAQKPREYLCLEIGNDQFVILSDKFKILAVLESPTVDITVVKGVAVNNIEIGKNAEFTEEVKNNFLNLLNLLENNDLINYIKVIDLSDPMNILLNYNDKVDIKLGSFDKIEYKIRTAKELLNKKIPQLASGTLNLSMLSVGKRSYFKPKT